MKIFKIIGILLCTLLLVLLLEYILSSNTVDKIKLSNSENLFQTLEKLENVKLLRPQDIKVDTDTWKALSSVCVQSQSGDSNWFGFSTAINNEHLVIGDPKANRVIVYNRDEDKKWLRSTEILPPKDSLAEQVGSGFGGNLALDGNTLVILAETENPSSDYSLFRAVYRTFLDQKNLVERIDVDRKDLIIGNRIAADNGKIVFTEQEKNKNGLINKTYVNILTNLKIKRIRKKNSIFNAVSIKNNILLIGDIELQNKTYAWKVDLNSFFPKLKKLSLPFIHLGREVAISDRFFAANVGLSLNILEHNYETTIVKSINNDSTVVFYDSDFSKVYLDRNILARVKFSEPMIPGSNSILEIYRLDNNAMPHLILKRVKHDGKGYRVTLQNGFLVTTQTEQVCIENFY